jgi:hypothetical protein
MKKQLLVLSFTLVLCLSAVAQTPFCPAGSITVGRNGQYNNLYDAVAAHHNDNTTFCILNNVVHSDFDVLNQFPQNITTLNKLTFTGGRLPMDPDGPVIESGAIGLPLQNQQWTPATICNPKDCPTYHTTPAGQPIYDADNPNLFCINSVQHHLTCHLSQALYFNEQIYQRVDSLVEMGQGSWYYEVQGLTAVAVPPSVAGSGYTQNEILFVQGGLGCGTSDPWPPKSNNTPCGTVRVLSTDGTASAIEVHAPGYGYTASGAPWATSPMYGQTPGGGSGAMVTVVAAGSGGMNNNIYLLDDPKLAKVELGENATYKNNTNNCGPGGTKGVRPSQCAPQYLFHSDCSAGTTCATNITIENLTVKKYAGPLEFAPISVNSSGSFGTADGWTIQNNTVTQNAHDGIWVGFGNGLSMTVSGNTVSGNGQTGISGGAPASAITVSGNHVSGNDAVFVPSGYGCGSIKFGGASTTKNGVTGSLTVSGNNVHDEPNGCGGLWSDNANSNVFWENNTVSNITGEGIRIEISGGEVNGSDVNTTNIVVSNNTVTGSGQSPIHVVSSCNTTVESNNVTAGPTGAGIAVSCDGQRLCDSSTHNTKGCFLNNVSLANDLVEGNRIIVPTDANCPLQGHCLGGLINWSHATWQPGTVFTGTPSGTPGPNTYCVPSLDLTNWSFGGSPATFSVWQSAAADNQDPNGVVALSGTHGCP